MSAELVALVCVVASVAGVVLFGVRACRNKPESIKPDRWAPIDLTGIKPEQDKPKS